MPEPIPEPKPQMDPADAMEIRRLQKILKPTNAPHFETGDRFRREYNMWVIEQFSPMGEAVINDFNFKTEEGRDAAKALIHKLAPPEEG